MLLFHCGNFLDFFLSLAFFIFFSSLLSFSAFTWCLSVQPHSWASFIRPYCFCVFFYARLPPRQSSKAVMFHISVFLQTVYLRAKVQPIHPCSCGQGSPPSLPLYPSLFTPSLLLLLRVLTRQYVCLLIMELSVWLTAIYLLTTIPAMFFSSES